MYTKKQKALYRGLCYGLCVWLAAAMVATLLVAFYIEYFDDTLNASEVGARYQLPLFIMAGGPAFVFGYLTYKE